MFNRLTDRVVRERIGKKPLEVGADRIARTAHAALALLQAVREATGREIPIIWELPALGVGAIEVYPAATLLARGIDIRGYKGPDGAAARRSLLDRLAPAWELRTDPTALAASDDALDAAVCLISASDFLAGRCVAPGPEERAQAEKESWIWCSNRI